MEYGETLPSQGTSLVDGTEARSAILNQDEWDKVMKHIPEETYGALIKDRKSVV